MPAPPVELGKAQIEVAERATGGDIGEPEAGRGEPFARAEQPVEFRRARLDLARLAPDPVAALEIAGPAALEHGEHHRVAHAVGERLDLLVGDAQLRIGRNELRRAERLEVLHDHLRVVHHASTIEDQRRHFPQRVRSGHGGAAGPGVLDDLLERDALLAQRYAHLARERARFCDDELHGVDGTRPFTFPRSHITPAITAGPRAPPARACARSARAASTPRRSADPHRRQARGRRRRCRSAVSRRELGRMAGCAGVRGDRGRGPAHPGVLGVEPRRRQELFARHARS